MKTTELDIYGIVITDLGGENGSTGAAISSDMKDTTCVEGDDDYEDTVAFNIAVDGVESLILAHYCAGIDVTAPAYKEGVDASYQALGQNLC
ncbi:hypothetical protein [Moritella sp. F3]|uniref:hypothetical protein n=1 Tax=Moritella sp. F3 TaxID=2718882 RepID=UPI0018E196FD|nr:hypothetical protein [Moritella sp. F3]GIC77090.1 hypothetical protein FMO001_18170 [Moritella sp. F1]GIC82209.1 hypothetical protein FMO003_24900 [Moritella sp. F3]